METKREIRLVAFDLDGTTLQRGNVLSDRNRQAMEKAAAAGVYAVPCTGRNKSFLPPCLKELPCIRYAITSNGAAVWDLHEDRCICANLISPETAAKVAHMAEKFKVYIEFYVNGISVTQRGNPEKAESWFGFPPEKLFFTKKNYFYVDDLVRYALDDQISVEKINFMYVPDAVRDDFYAALRAIGGLEISYSNVDNFELNAKNCDKGWGLRALCETLCVPSTATMGIGDNGNDFGLLREAAFSVAVDNAIPEVKAMCDAVVSDYREDGFAEAVERFALNEER